MGQYFQTRTGLQYEKDGLFYDEIPVGDLPVPGQKYRDKGDGDVAECVRVQVTHVRAQEGLNRTLVVLKNEGGEWSGPLSGFWAQWEGVE